MGGQEGGLAGGHLAPWQKANLVYADLVLANLVHADPVEANLVHAVQGDQLVAEDRELFHLRDSALNTYELWVAVYSALVVGP